MMKRNEQLEMEYTFVKQQANVTSNEWAVFHNTKILLNVIYDIEENHSKMRANASDPVILAHSIFNILDGCEHVIQSNSKFISRQVKDRFKMLKRRTNTLVQTIEERGSDRKLRRASQAFDKAVFGLKEHKELAENVKYNIKRIILTA